MDVKSEPRNRDRVKLDLLYLLTIDCQEKARERVRTIAFKPRQVDLKQTSRKKHRRMRHVSLQYIGSIGWRCKLPAPVCHGFRSVPYSLWRTTAEWRAAAGYRQFKLILYFISRESQLYRSGGQTQHGSSGYIRPASFLSILLSPPSSIDF